MAINPNTQYPGKVAAPDANYPYGGAQNITVPGDGTGTPWEAALLNDIFGLQQSLLKSSGIVPSGTPDKVATSQYLQSLVELSCGRADTFVASGTGSAIVLTTSANQEPPKSFYIGLTVKFIPVANSSGTITLDFPGLGIKLLKSIDGTALKTNGITTGIIAQIMYDGVQWRHVNPINESSGTFTPGLFGSVSGAGVRPTYSGQTGHYVRQGNLMFVYCTVSISALGSVLGDINIDGFPFNINSSFPILNFQVLQLVNVALTTNYHNILFTAAGGGTPDALNVSQMRDIQGAGNNIALTDVNLGVGSLFEFSGMYRIT